MKLSNGFLFEVIHITLRHEPSRLELVCDRVLWPTSLKVDNDAPRETWRDVGNQVGQRTDAFFKLHDASGDNTFGLHVKILGPNSKLSNEVVDGYKSRSHEMTQSLNYKNGKCLLFGPKIRLDSNFEFISSFDGSISYEELTSIENLGE